MILLEDLLYEEYENEGTDYETQVLNAVVAAGMAPRTIAGAASDRHSVDAAFTLKDRDGNIVGPYRLEIKKDFKAQKNHFLFRWLLQVQPVR